MSVSAWAGAGTIANSTTERKMQAAPARRSPQSDVSSVPRGLRSGGAMPLPSAPTTKSATIRTESVGLYAHNVGAFRVPA